MITTAHPSRSTREAWFLLTVAFGLYSLSQVILTKYSILWGTAAGQILFFLLPALLFARWKTSSVKEALRLRTVPFSTLVRVTLIALAGIGAAFLCEQMTRPLVTRYFADWIPMLEFLQQLLMPKTVGGLVRNLIVIGLIAPVCEEVLLRGAFQGTLERRGPVRAIAWTSLVFGVIHMNPFNFIGPILMGVGLGLVVWRTGSILPAILWHAVHNSVVVLMVGLEWVESTPPWWVNVGLTILCGLLLWEFIRHTRATAPAPSLLATAPPMPVGRGPILVISAAVCGCLVLLVAVASRFETTKLGHDLFTPDYAAEDIVYVTGKTLRPFIRIQPDDIVYWKPNEGQGTYFSRVSRIEDGKLTLLAQPLDGDPYELEINSGDVIGKIVWKLDAGEEMNELQRQINAKRDAKEGRPRRTAWATAPVIKTVNLTQILTVTSPGKPAAVPLEPSGGQVVGPVVVDLSVNGQPARFLVDTSSPAVCLLNNALEGLGLLSSAVLGTKVEAGTQHEQITGYVKSAAFVIGDGTTVRVENALVVPDDANDSYQGVLSPGFLYAIGAVIDFGAKTLRLGGDGNNVTLLPSNGESASLSAQDKKPPYSGTIFPFPSIILESDPTTFTELKAKGNGTRHMFDRRPNKWGDYEVFIFGATFSDGEKLEIAVNLEFETKEAAREQAEFYANAFGRLPRFLRENIEALWIHQGKETFGGGPRMTIHTGQGAEYISLGILEEALAHGAASALNAKHATATKWIEAQAEDGQFISTHAKADRFGHDVAESFVPYLAARYRSARITSEQLKTITETMPNRIAYFDGLKPDMAPIVASESNPGSSGHRAKP
jgi:membrane protease YdiL (CAAX protease family)